MPSKITSRAVLPRFRLPTREYSRSRQAQEASCSLGQDEAHGIDGTNSGERIRQRSANRDRRIGKRSRRGEPVSRANPCGHPPRRFLDARRRVNTTRTNPAVATTSDSHCAAPVRECDENCNSGSSNITFASIAPEAATDDLHGDVGGSLAIGSNRFVVATSVMTGLKCAPVTGPKSAMSTARAATVAPVLASSATAMFPSANRSRHDSGADNGCGEKQRARAPPPIAAASCDVVGQLAPSDGVQALLQLDLVQRPKRQTREDLECAARVRGKREKRCPLFVSVPCTEPRDPQCPSGQPWVDRAISDRFRRLPCHKP